jgi:hypothetical protein
MAAQAVLPLKKAKASGNSKDHESGKRQDQCGKRKHSDSSSGSGGSEEESDAEEEEGEEEAEEEVGEEETPVMQTKGKLLLSTRLDRGR